MERYESYKDSGVEWIGEIPSHWGCQDLKYSVDLITEKGIPEEDSVRISPENVESGTGVCTNLSSNHIGEGVMFQKDDILLNKLRLYLKKILFMDVEGYSMGEMIVLRTKRGVPRYHFYTLFDQGWIDFMDSHSTGIKLPRVSPEDILNSRLPLPPLDVQEQIVEFLDRKTTLIDSLIEKTEKRIELLKEKRTSLINEVVTKGLNPDVEMKDSGVEWIGEIPSHWGRKRLKHVSESVNGYSFKSVDFDKGYDIPVIRIGDVGDSINFSNCVRVKSHYLEDKREFLVKKNDILIGLTGGTIGKSGKYNYDSPSLLNQRVGLLRTKGDVLNKLLFFYVKSEVFIRYIFFDCYGGGQDNISMNDILNMVFPLPPLHEQEQIVEYLDEQTSIIDSTITTEEKRIELLKEYRQSLISEVVTGKCRVS